jgi:hypothetical protein
MLKNLILGALLAAQAVHAANFFPLSPGNSWTYRSASGETFEITIGLNPIMTGGQVYHQVTGYATRPLFLRRGDNGVIFWLNHDQNREEILTDIRPLSGAYYTTEISAPREQPGHPVPRPQLRRHGHRE